MLSARLARASGVRAAASAARRLPVIQRRTMYNAEWYPSPQKTEQEFPEYKEFTEKEDPGQNGGYINPPRIKRQFRDPHADWFDKQERRNFGEPVHEDHDILGMMSPYEYTHMTAKEGVIGILAFVSAVVAVMAFTITSYPDKPSYPREFEGGLERELGGPGAVRARMAGDADP